MVTSPGYILVTGMLCLALDLVHLKYGVEVPPRSPPEKLTREP